MRQELSTTTRGNSLPTVSLTLSLVLSVMLCGSNSLGAGKLSISKKIRKDQTRHVIDFKSKSYDCVIRTYRDILSHGEFVRSNEVIDAPSELRYHSKKSRSRKSPTKNNNHSLLLVGYNAQHRKPDLVDERIDDAVVTKRMNSAKIIRNYWKGGKTTQEIDFLHDSINVKMSYKPVKNKFNYYLLEGFVYMWGGGGKYDKVIVGTIDKKAEGEIFWSSQEIDSETTSKKMVPAVDFLKSIQAAKKEIPFYTILWNSETKQGFCMITQSKAFQLVCGTKNASSCFARFAHYGIKKGTTITDEYYMYPISAPILDQTGKRLLKKVADGSYKIQLVTRSLF